MSTGIMSKYFLVATLTFNMHIKMLKDVVPRVVASSKSRNLEGKCF